MYPLRTSFGIGPRRHCMISHQCSLVACNAWCPHCARHMESASRPVHAGHVPADPAQGSLQQPPSRTSEDVRVLCRRRYGSQHSDSSTQCVTSCRPSTCRRGWTYSATCLGCRTREGSTLLVSPCSSAWPSAIALTHTVSGVLWRLASQAPACC
ncbi:uncharacterized protein B0H18DRAFT_1002201 [Fomitopsis serialis]|uniref:uncharacterized protein n=1 Tax=Fomitopsis serialis TaxID=139415 RepID=UPI002008D36A|nr:uncharacterized protein B0H18DRAFT_1002201 [Neoantrodia serialis]KAH9927791.1 hypothetical protein B0H18DRAFT_1002201 [Neoantrodia serialis]